MKRSKIILVLVLLVGALTMAACSGSAEKDAEIIEEVVAQPTKTAPPPTPEPTATEEMIMLPVSMVSAALGEDDNQYKVELPNFMPVDFEESELPAPPGTVFANWFTSSGFYVVGYYGLDLETSGALCPGNTILTGGNWQYISNAPTAEGACEGFPTLTEDPDVGPWTATALFFTAQPSPAICRAHCTVRLKC